MLRRLLSVKRPKPFWANPKDTLPHEQAEAEEKELWWQEQLASGETWTRKNHVYK